MEHSGAFFTPFLTSSDLGATQYKPQKYSWVLQYHHPLTGRS